MQEPGPSQFKCLFEGCGKTFTRKDHLVRHANNHSETSHYCPSCGKGFKRPDLLLRHTKRGVCSNPSDRKRPRTSGSHESPMDDLATFFDPSTLSEANVAGGGGGVAGHLALGAGGVAAGSKGLAVGAGGAGMAGVSRMIETPVVWSPASWEENLAFWLIEGPAADEGAQTYDFQAVAGGKRVQESAERGGEVKLASPGLRSRLVQAYGATVLSDLDLPWLTEAMQSYWSNVAPTAPFIHRGTFDVDTAPLELVMMMVVTGSVHLSPRRDMRQVVSTIRSQLTSKTGLDMPVSVTQTYALCHIYDTWYGSRDAQFMAQCSWAIMVAHSRKKGLGVMGKAEIDAHDGEEAWTKWAKEEERRRSAYCVFLLDTQTSTFWSTHPARQLSVFAHNLPLPCSKLQWEAQSVAEWLRCREAPSIPSGLKPRRSAFMPTLNPEFNVSNVADGFAAAILAALNGEQTPQFKIDDNNKFAVEMVLMGLMAAAWDCKTKGQLGLRFRDSAKHWRDIIMNAVIELRKNWENSTSHNLPCIETHDLRDSFALSIVFVLCDIPMLLVAAGATTVSGTHIGPKQVAEAKRRIKIWHKTDDAFKCLWQSSRYLRASLYNDWGMYTPWAVYLATLVVWAFAAGSQGEDHVFHPSSDSRNAVNSLLDSALQMSGRPESLEAGIGDLLVEVAEMLQTGEEIMREEAAILLKLAGRPVLPNGNP